MSQNIRELRAMAHAILTHADCYKWSLQGFGMLRLHLDDDVRLHIWDDRYRVPDVSLIHDHAQWGLKSTIISGAMRNTRFAFSDRVAPSSVELTEPYGLYRYATIKAGVGGGMVSESKLCILKASKAEKYGPGGSYSQEPNEIHLSWPDNGCVTIMAKTPNDTDTARVFWPHNKQWVSAEPRAATRDEVDTIVANALRGWT